MGEKPFAPGEEPGDKIEEEVEEKMKETSREKFGIEEQAEKIGLLDRATIRKITTKEIEEKKTKFAIEWFERNQKEKVSLRGKIRKKGRLEALMGISGDFSDKAKVNIAIELGAFEDLEKKVTWEEENRKIKNLSALTMAFGDKVDNISITDKFLMLNSLQKMVEETREEIETRAKKLEKLGKEEADDKEIEKLDKLEEKEEELNWVREQLAENISGRNLREEANKKVDPQKERDAYVKNNLPEALKEEYMTKELEKLGNIKDLKEKAKRDWKVEKFIWAKVELEKKGEKGLKKEFDKDELEGMYIKNITEQHEKDINEEIENMLKEKGGEDDIRNELKTKEERKERAVKQILKEERDREGGLKKLTRLRLKEKFRKEAKGKRLKEFEKSVGPEEIKRIKNEAGKRALEKKKEIDKEDEKKGLEMLGKEKIEEFYQNALREKFIEDRGARAEEILKDMSAEEIEEDLTEQLKVDLGEIEKIELGNKNEEELKEMLTDKRKKENKKELEGKELKNLSKTFEKIFKKKTREGKYKDALAKKAEKKIAEDFEGLEKQEKEKITEEFGKIQEEKNKKAVEKNLRETSMEKIKELYDEKEVTKNLEDAWNEKNSDKSKKRKEYIQEVKEKEIEKFSKSPEEARGGTGRMYAQMRERLIMDRIKNMKITIPEGKKVGELFEKIGEREEGFENPEEFVKDIFERRGLQNLTGNPLKDSKPLRDFLRKRKIFLSSKNVNDYFTGGTPEDRRKKEKAYMEAIKESRTKRKRRRGLFGTIINLIAFTLLRET